eukprot:TRINITY_DN8131_c1_g1_i2.p4 TRINITY_DN8131_c1_g1~~TRINITY_DN8131_c1_g1_i2.p4  ORF type:complete len:107 (-),score=0.44 TRINITY_DN8131_c1_g1_i2:790-1110(-)
MKGTSGTLAQKPVYPQLLYLLAIGLSTHMLPDTPALAYLCYIKQLKVPKYLWKLRVGNGWRKLKSIITAEYLLIQQYCGCKTHKRYNYGYTQRSTVIFVWWSTLVF